MYSSQNIILFGIFVTLITTIVLVAPVGFPNNHFAIAQASDKTRMGMVNTSSNNTLASTNSLNNAINKLNFTNVIGIISSLQNDASGKPTWIASGQFQMLLFKPRVAEQKLQPAFATFSTLLSMVHLNGTTLHQHSISDFKLTNANSSTTNRYSIVTFNGTATVTLTDSPHLNVPISIKIMNSHTISLWIDPTKVQNHFGNTPIYGIVLSQGG
ncbi:hypothetical protein DYY65_11425 [Nitrososphaera sp. AFS]|nr:hypothetical protein [Nitrososphaera sp. AFS]